MPGSRMFIDPKMQVPVEDLIKGLIVQSGNDATVALAEGVGGTVEHFVELMNEQAKALGMKNTTYKNPEGLTAPGHMTTARDLGILATRLLRDYPDEVKYYAIKKYRYPGTPSTNDTNRNLLLFRDPTVDGLKTGHTEAAGYCMIVTAKRDFPNLAGGRRLLSIVLGTASENARANESQKLLNWGYTAYDAVRLFDGGQPVATPAVWKGKQNTMKIGRVEPIVVAVPSGSAEQDQDADRAPRSAGRAIRQEPGHRLAQGHAGRPAGDRRPARGARESSSSPASWAVPGMRCGSGSSSRFFATSLRRIGDCRSRSDCYNRGLFGNFRRVSRFRHLRFPVSRPGFHEVHLGVHKPQNFWTIHSCQPSINWCVRAAKLRRSTRRALPCRTRRNVAVSAPASTPRRQRSRTPLCVRLPRCA